MNIAKNGRFVFKDVPENVVKNGMQLIALSTCADAETNGRQLLVATMKMRTKPLPSYLFEDNDVPLAVWGHGEADHWALLNLICVIMTLAILLPGIRIRKKYKGFSTLIKDRASKQNQQKLLGILIQIAAAAFSVFWFIFTEDPHKPMVIVDRWTLAMIVLFGLTWFTDVYLVKYQRNKTTDKE